MKKYKIIIIVLAILLAIIFLLGFYYNYQTSPMSKNSEKVVVEIKEGTISSIGETLYKNGLIRSKLVFKIYIKLNKINSLKASTYELDKKMKLSEIIDVLKEGNSYNPNQIKVTFKEGLNIRKIAKVVEEETDNTYDDFMNLMNDSEYIDTLITDYWFLTEDIKNTKIYYPLEGYLFPNTYAFSGKDVTPKEIVKTMLDETDKQLSKYKELINASKLSVHEIMTLASIVELEGASSDDRASVAGVFYNRINNDWSLGSDVTTYYYLKIDNFKESLNGNKNLYTCDNAYNTRCNTFKGLPIGPISNPGLESINATINYKKHDYFYFVADCNGKTYLNKNSTGHYNTIQKLKNENNWCV